MRVDADTLGRVLQRASVSPNDLATASLVDAAARELTRVESLPGAVERGDSVDQIRSHITLMLLQDPVGVLQNYSRRVDPDGQGALTDYFGSMIRSGQTDTLGQIVGSLSTGGGTAASSADWALQIGSDLNRPGVSGLFNAETLGFTVGSIGRAIERTSDSARERAALVERLAGGAAALAGMAPDPRAVGAAALVAQGVSAVADSFADETVAASDALIGYLTRRFTPRFAGPEGEPVRDSALEAYRDAVTAAMSGRETESEYGQITGRSSAAP